MQEDVMTSERPLLQMRDMTSGYGPIVAVRDLTLQVFPREIVALLGANGAGKSTTLMTIAGLLHPSEGSIEFDGEDITHVNTEEIVRLGISLTPEGRRIFAHLTVVENLRVGAVMHRDRAEVAESVEEMFDLFPILRQRSGQYAGTLSGGEQQMLALARSLMSRPRMMLLDEPSLGLAPIVVAQIFDLLRQLPSRGVTVLLVEQNVQLALDVASRGYVLAGGEVQTTGSADELRREVDVEHIYLGGETS